MAVVEAPEAIEIGAADGGAEAGGAAVCEIMKNLGATRGTWKSMTGRSIGIMRNILLVRIIRVTTRAWSAQSG